MQCTMAQIGEVRSGYQSRRAITPAPQGGYRLLQLRDVAAGGAIDWASVVRFDADLSRSDTPLRDGDVLVQAKGSSNAALSLTDVPARTLAAGCFFVVRPDPGRVLPAYLAWYLNQPATRRQLQRQSGRGVQTPIIRRSVLENLGIPLPPLYVQEQIVHVLALLETEERLVAQRLQERRELVARACLNAVSHSYPEA